MARRNASKNSAITEVTKYKLRVQAIVLETIQEEQAWELTWEAPKENPLRALFRVGLLTKKLYLCFAKEMFTMGIAEIRKTSSGLTILHGPASQETVESLAHGLYEFPEELCKQAGLTEEDREGLLMYMLCENAVSYFTQIYASLLNGIIPLENIKERRCLVGETATRKIFRQYSNGEVVDLTWFWHAYIEVTLPDTNENFVIDLTSAQNGFHFGPVVPMVDFEDRCKAIMEKWSPLGRCRQKNFEGWQEMPHSKAASTCFVHAVQERERKSGSMMPWKLGLSDEKWEREAEEIVKGLREGLRRYKSMLEVLYPHAPIPEYKDAQ